MFQPLNMCMFLTFSPPPPNSLTFVAMLLKTVCKKENHGAFVSGGFFSDLLGKKGAHLLTTSVHLESVYKGEQREGWVYRRKQKAS